ncbi:MAG: hypothetical protein JF606_18530 [Burkholderiales bacterium]|nr:hypothetical protein [Burkholderiales bacterium]
MPSNAWLVRSKAGVTLHQLEAQALVQTDLAAAQAMQKAKAELFAKFNATSLEKQPRA